MSAKTSLGSSLFYWDARRRLRAALSGVRVRGLSALREQLQREPLILAMNHVAFWDGFLVACLERAAGADAYCLMDRGNLARLGFLRWAGAIPLERGEGDSAQRLRDVRRAVSMLDRPGRLLVIFPQGTQRPAHLPLRFQRGALVLARAAGVRVVPAGLRYDFADDPRPEARVSLGAAMRLEGAGAGQLQRLEDAVRDELAAIDALNGASADDALSAAFAPLLPVRGGGLPLGTRLLGALFARRLP